MQKRSARAGQILHAQEHAVFLRRGAHQQRFAVSFARLERHAGVAQLAAQQQALQVDQRFVDHHRLDLRRRVHAIFRMGPQVAVRRLLDVLHAAKRRRRARFELAKKIEHVLDALRTSR